MLNTLKNNFKPTYLHIYRSTVSSAQKFFLLKAFGFPLVGFLILIAVTLAVWKSGLIVEANIESSYISLPSNMSASMGNDFAVPIVIVSNDSGLVGVDVSLQFDPLKVQLVGVEPTVTSSNTFKSYAPVDENNNFDISRIVTQGNSSGKINFSATTFNAENKTVGTSFKGSAQIATLRFRPLVAGNTQISFDVLSGSTTDTNLVGDETIPTDKLISTTQTTNLNLTIGQSTTLPSPTPTLVPTPTPSPTPSPTGSSSPTPTVFPTSTPTPTPAPDKFTIIASADTYVSSSSPSLSYGSNDTLYVDKEPEKTSYLKFDLSKVNSTEIYSAQLSFKTTPEQYSGSPDGVEIYLVEESSWQENMSYLEQPPISTTRLGTIASTNGNTTYNIDLVLAEVKAKAGGILSLVLVPTGSDAMYFYSRESNAYQPRLLLNGGASIGSTVKIYAAGTKAGGLYPFANLLIDDKVVATYSNVSGDYRNRQFLEYVYVHSTKVNASQVRVEFFNDYKSGSRDRNLMVDKIQIDGVDHQTEADTTFGIGVWSGNKCSQGYLKTEWLYCNGYFDY